MQMKGGDGGGRPPVRTGVIYQRHSINIDSQGPVFLPPHRVPVSTGRWLSARHSSPSAR